jgi:hypothetical protein
MQYLRIVAVALAMLPLAALAQSTAQPSSTTAPPETPSPALKQARAKMRTACATDVQKLCANVERGKGAVVGCLRTHGSELSPECTSARAELKATRLKEKN